MSEDEIAQKAWEQFNKDHDADAFFNDVSSVPFPFGFRLPYYKALVLHKIKRDKEAAEQVALAIKHFEGIHNFKNFVSNEAVKESYEREIYKTSIEEKDNKLYIRFTGNGFMKYQVRNMVGTLIKIGNGKLEEDIIDKILTDEEYAKYVYTAKSEGLYLENIKY